MSQNIIYKLNTTTNTPEKISNNFPVKENQEFDINWFYAPYGSNAVKVKFNPKAFLGLTNVNPIPALKMTRETDTDIINNVVPEASQESNWSLYYFPIGSGVSGILQSSRATEYGISFQQLDIDLEDAEYSGEYATASTVAATIDTELKSEFGSATEDDYVNVYKTTTDEYTSWVLGASDWTDYGSVINESVVGNTVEATETFKHTTLSNDSFNMGTPEAQALVLNTIYGELEALNTLVTAITGDITGLMTIGDYDTEGTATDSVKYARNIGTNGASIAYAAQLAKNALLDQDVKQAASPEFANVTIGGVQVETQDNKDANNGYPGLSASGKIALSALPDNVKVVIRWFGSVTGDLPSSGVENGYTYVCETADYTSTVSGDTYNEEDTATYWDTEWIKNDNAELVTSVNLKTGVVVLDQYDVYDEYIGITQTDDGSGGTKNRFDMGAPLGYTYADHQRVYLDVHSLEAGSGLVSARFNSNSAYEPVYGYDGTQIELSTLNLFAKHIVAINYDSKWYIMDTDGDFAVLSGGVNWNGDSIADVVAENDAQNIQIVDLQTAVATPGENILQAVAVTTPITASLTPLTKLVFDTNSTVSNNTAYLDVDANLDHIIVDSESPGFSATGNYQITKVGGNPNTDFNITFYMFKVSLLFHYHSIELILNMI